MNVYVVGAGAVGCYLGDALRATGAEVAFAPRRIDDVDRVAPDLAIVAVKSYDTPAAIETLRRALDPAVETTILTPQNGVGNEERLAAAFGADRIVSGALTVPVERAADGAFVAARRGGISLAPVGSVSQNWLVAAFERTSIPVRVSGDYRSLKWSKLALNLVANASCAILDMMPDRIVRTDALFEMEMRAVRECRAVMKKLGLTSIDLPRYPVRALYAVASLPPPLARLALARRIAGARGRKVPSLLLDARAGKGRSEVDVLSGAVAAAGLAAGIETPVNAVFARVLADIVQMPSLWAKYRERPAALLAEIAAEERRLASAVAP